MLIHDLVKSLRSSGILATYSLAPAHSPLCLVCACSPGFNASRINTRALAMLQNAKLDIGEHVLLANTYPFSNTATRPFYVLSIIFYPLISLSMSRISCRRPSGYSDHGEIKSRTTATEAKFTARLLDGVPDRAPVDVRVTTATVFDFSVSKSTSNAIRTAP
ncbi:hypothetical protein BT96DRAFT_230296 [Gymnopus androsaceus JB14]|uniref:Uncharacterized protein n=1 Tax=Gymnopus androsaceus JB14 TaxID=1447944 RepID=A0A6A4GAR9_9AGAR|nr:hypothetical protein BT96DRAFT_230296 [Gymnopus androsaceus JB14]